MLIYISSFCARVLVVICKYVDIHPIIKKYKCMISATFACSYENRPTIRIAGLKTGKIVFLCDQYNT
jgi:hypothetical protein